MRINVWEPVLGTIRESDDMHVPRYDMNNKNGTFETLGQ